MGYFTNRYKKMCEDFEEVVPTEKYLRLNPLKGLPESTLKQIESLGVELEETSLTNCYSYTSKFALSGTTEHLLGLFYLQGLASQVVAHVLQPKKDQVIIDMAAAPGSKTTHMAQMMNNTGIIIALDSNARRLDAVRDNCERLGVTNVLTVTKDARYATDLNIKADAVLLDAPCSGNFCSEEGWENKRTIDDIKKNARLQKDLLISAYRLLKPNGTLVYSTCSLEPEENELIVDWFLQKYEDMIVEILPVKLHQSPGLTAFGTKKLHPDLKKCGRFWPHKTATEGFFVAKLRKHPGT